MQGLATAVVALDSDFNIIFLNEAAEALLHTGAAKVRGLSIERVIRDKRELITACEKAAADEGDFRLRNHSVLLPTMMARKQIDCTVTKPALQDETCILLEMIAVDTAGQVARDREFAARQQSNQAVLRGLAHEIRNPLGGIRGAAQLLAQEAGSHVFEEYTQVIIREADRLTNLVNRMQARTSVNLDQSVNIHDVLQHVRTLVLADAGSLVQIRQDYDPSLPLVRGDRELLVQAMFNVMRNAVDAVSMNKHDGEIILRTRIDHIASGQDRNKGNRMAVRVDVNDNGAGINEEIAARIFDPMVTNKAGGAGLGLPITAEIITRHSGAIDFTSEPANTTFRLFIPACLESENANRVEQYCTG